jgi:hypothetical protein
MRIAFLTLLLLLTACVTEDPGVAAARMEAQDDASCLKLSAGKSADAYQQCRQNLIGYRQQARAQAQADSAARAQALANFGEALSATGDAMRAASPSRTSNNDTTHCVPDRMGGMTCTSY